MESIGPSFGETVANSAVLAVIVSLLVISIFITLRFEWKIAVPVLIALMHDILIVAGVYALVGREVTTSTVAALLTILGYSLYDTIIVFDRIRENVPRMPSAAYSQIVNRSLSEVIVRSLATSFCTLLPVLALLLFGGETLQDFAFALLIGIASGTYSSIFIATPVLQHWKEREPGFRARRQRIEQTLGEVPAYATTAQGGPIDVAPKERKGRRVSAPPGQQVSATEFQEMVKDLGVDEDGRGARAAARRGRAARPAGGRRARVARERRRRHAAGNAALGGNGGDDDAEGAKAAQQASREAPLMALLVWTMVGLALWHFTVFLPDKFWAGIVGAFLGALVGSILFGDADQLDLPRRDSRRGRHVDPGSGSRRSRARCSAWACVVDRRAPDRRRARAALLAHALAAFGPDRPQPVARAGERRAEVALGRAERVRGGEVATDDPDAAGVVARARERHDEAAAGPQHARRLGERLAPSIRFRHSTASNDASSKRAGSPATSSSGGRSKWPVLGSPMSSTRPSMSRSL